MQIFAEGQFGRERRSKGRLGNKRRQLETHLCSRGHGELPEAPAEASGRRASVDITQSPQSLFLF